MIRSRAHLVLGLAFVAVTVAAGCSSSSSPSTPIVGNATAAPATALPTAVPTSIATTIAASPTPVATATSLPTAPVTPSAAPTAAATPSAAPSQSATAASDGCPELATGNLLVNAGAEMGAGSTDGGTVEPVPYWTPGGSFSAVQYGAPAYPQPADTGPPNRGANFFAGGPNMTPSTGTQPIDLSGFTDSISAGTVQYELCGYLGGFDSQDDNATFTITFLDANAASLGTATIGPVLASDRNDETSLLERDTSGPVPPGTVSAIATLTMTRLEGTANDGYADNLDFSISVAVPHVLTHRRRP